MNKSILIVEDDKDIRTSLGMMFEFNGWTVFQASEGYEALEVYKKEKPNVVLTDINMPFKEDGITPGLNGIELINELTLLYKDNLPLIFVNSGCLTNEMLTNQIQSVLAYYHKPTPASEIISSLESHLINKQAA